MAGKPTDRRQHRKEHWKRWERGRAMELWQMDVVHGFALADGTSAKALDKWVAYYNTERAHQSLGDATPVIYRSSTGPPNPSFGRAALLEGGFGRGRVRPGWERVP